MKTKTWSPGENRTTNTVSTPAAGPMDWLSTPLVFVTLRTAPAEMEIISALYQVIRNYRAEIPFTLELRSGELLVSYSKDEFFVAEEFKLPLQVFEKVMGLERAVAVQETLNTLQAKVDVLNAQRDAHLFEQQQAQASAEQAEQMEQRVNARAADPVGNEAVALDQAPEVDSGPAPSVETTARSTESSDSSGDIRSMLSGSPGRQSRAGTNRRRT
ncbi:hypothetical protein [Burkholderia cenocepacia]|uniref:hypothetical protein n=1 Tax=Burkholderia cenocepacia TaxID=95486 RepID=UPI0007613BEC|nr:hypothetical protein [Burkholderia cenocepacia]KWU17777.1 hypothetical protein AS149_13740 [Burkholderia cenocepacia]